MSDDERIMLRLLEFDRRANHPHRPYPRDDSLQAIVRDIRHTERERCIAAMVASQPEGMRAVMEQRYREILEQDAARTTPAAKERQEPR